MAELERIDLLIQVQLQRSQQIQSTDTAFQGLYISEEDLEAMLAKPVGTTNAERVQLWQKNLRGNTDFGSDADLKILSSKFRFSGGQIEDATVTAQNIAHWRDPEQQHLTMADIYACCRLHSNRKLSNLATKINPSSGECISVLNFPSPTKKNVAVFGSKFSPSLLPKVQM